MANGREFLLFQQIFHRKTLHWEKQFLELSCCCKQTNKKPSNIWSLVEGKEISLKRDSKMERKIIQAGGKKMGVQPPTHSKNVLL